MQSAYHRGVTPVRGAAYPIIKIAAPDGEHGFADGLCRRAGGIALVRRDPEHPAEHQHPCTEHGGAEDSKAADAHGRGFSFPNMLHQVHGISHLLKYRPLPPVLCFLFCLFGCSKALQKILQCNY